MIFHRPVQGLTKENKSLYFAPALLPNLGLSLSSDWPDWLTSDSNIFLARVKERTLKQH